jgi:hypothetical protein
MADDPLLSSVEDAPVRLQWRDQVAELRCKIWIDRDGSVHWQSQPVVLTRDTKWLMPLQIPAAELATPITFSADVPDGGIFSSDYAYISSHQPRIKINEPDTISVGGGFSQAKIVYEALPADTKDLAVVYRAAGMKGFKVQSIETQVGRVTQQGPHEIEDYDLMSGLVTIVAPADPKPTYPWLQECEKMAFKIFDLLSLAQGKFFRWRDASPAATDEQQTPATPTTT